MYTIYKIHNGSLQTIEKVSKDLEFVWIHAESPTASELAELRALIPIPDEVVKDTQDVNEVPKLDKIDDVTFILLQTPIRGTQKKGTKIHSFSVRPLGILIRGKIVLTIAWYPNDVILYVQEKMKKVGRNFIIDTKQLGEFTLKFFLFTAKMYLRCLKDINQSLTIPTNTSHTRYDKEIFDFLNVEESLVYFNASLSSNDIVLKKIAKRKQFVATEEEYDLLDDAMDETRQALEMTQVYSRIVEDLRNAISSLISNDLSRKVNWLTKVTFILMVPTLVGTLYGMNVPLPFADKPGAFWLVLVVSIVSTIGSVLWLNHHHKD